MREILRAALVIARRDYGATVFSKTFLLFLIGPLLPIAAGILFALLGAGDSGPSAAPGPRIALALAPGEAALVRSAHAAVTRRLGDDALPALAAHGGKVDVVLGGDLDAPALAGSPAALRDARDGAALLVDQARTLRALGRAPPPPVALVERPLAHAAPPPDATAARKTTARTGQLILMFLTMLLAGMLLSNLIEEKSNKVIEVLAAAVPVDAIFAGKLLAMLGMSLTGIAVWGLMAAGAVVTLHLPFAALPPPAVGWPLFALLGLLYFCCCFLLLGAVFLGIGGQAASVRQVQTISMPVTMAQLGVVAFATRAAAAPDAPVGIAAAVFPWSSPFAMLARAALRPQLWPHLLALGWQALWIALIVWAASRLFRRSVLRSGGGRLGRRRAWRSGAASPSAGLEGAS